MMLLLACAPGEVVLELGDTGQHDPVAPDCGVAPFGVARFEDGAAVLELSMTAGVSRVGADEAPPVVTANLRSVGSDPLRGEWGGCGFPTWRVLDSAGNVAWEYSNDWDVSCTTAAFTWPTGEGLEDDVQLPSLSPGTWRLAATAYADFGDGGGTGHTVSTELVVGGDTCASHAVAAEWPSGLRVTVDPGPVPYDVSAPRELLASGEAVMSQRKVYADCRYPSFDVYDAQTWAPAWHYSAADEIACEPEEGWEVGDVRSDRASVPGGALAPGDYAFTAAFFATDGESYRVGSVLRGE